MPASLRSNQSYKNVFDDRGAAYQEAMLQFSSSRDNEFNSLFTRVPLNFNETILDIPSGGGYLSSFIQKKYPDRFISVASLDFSNSFVSENNNVKLAEEENLLGVYGIAQTAGAFCSLKRRLANFVKL